MLTSRIVLLALALAVVVLSVRTEAGAAPFTRPWQESDTWTLWPMPSHVTRGTASATVGELSFSTSFPSSFVEAVNSSSRAAHNNGTAQSLLNGAIARAQKMAFVFPTSAHDGTMKVLITVHSTSTALQLGVDESYTLTVNATECKITASTVWGAMYGIQTLMQVFHYDYNKGVYYATHLPLEVTDSPRFPWRGLLLDSARHYLLVDEIKHQIDALAYNKLNVLHWHTIDAQSFPICSKTRPELCDKGAYAAAAKYQPSEVEDIVQYGFERGVRVVPEFDMPGHAYSWGFGDPSVVSMCPSSLAGNINNFPLDPSQQHTFEVVNDFLADMFELFTDEFVHLGGDEVVFSCWSENPTVSSWMRSQGFTTIGQVEQYFLNQILPTVTARNMKFLCWQELFQNGVKLPSSSIVQVWKDAPTLDSVLRAGHQGIFSYGWYLDQQIPDPPTTHYEWEDTYIDFYNNEPTDGLSSSADLSKLLGGEAAMWGEQVDSVNFDGRVWPRACAVAERLWSPKSVNVVADATNRLVGHRCWMAQRGIRAGPIAPDYCPIPAGVFSP